MSKFRVVSSHPEDLADGRVVAPGEEVSRVDEKQPVNRRLIDMGRLVKVDQPKQEKASTKEGGDDK